MAEKETIIGPHTRVSGEIRGDEDVVVRGRVEGRVTLSSVFTVEESAIIQADIEARVVLISGVVVGNVHALETIRLAPRARMVGDITAPRVVMEEGATYKGRLEMSAASAEATESQAHSRTQASETREEDREKASPPRLSVPSRVAAAPASAPVPPARIENPAPAPPPPPRMALPIAGSADERPPSLPAPEVAAEGGVASAPSWAKKKLHRRT
jgi:cytoskeletal protein CcmA (bactofilin family)